MSCAHIRTYMPMWSWFWADTSRCNEAPCVPTDRKLRSVARLAVPAPCPPRSVTQATNQLGPNSSTRWYVHCVVDKLFALERDDTCCRAVPLHYDRFAIWW
jgi:hypothetical protein